VVHVLVTRIDEVSLDSQPVASMSRDFH